jgi:predicted ATPase/class 3 adenylate cyclase
MGVRPSGVVAFLFTDIEGSTSLWERHDEEMNAALAAHDEILRSGIDAGGGVVFSTAGDAFAVAFDSADSACGSALEIQARLGVHDWPTSAPIRVRMGLHVGEAHERDGDYFGPAVNRTARIMSAAHGGQVLVSASCASIVGTEKLVDLGEHRLKDLGAPERLRQLNRGSFPPLRTLDVARHNLPVERTPLLGRSSDIDQVVRLSAEHRLVTLLGIGGTGKTRLATAAAAELVDEATDGVWFVDLVPVSSATDVVTAIATATGLHVAGSELLGALADALRHRRMLIVLDNCEHITDYVNDVVDTLLARTVEPRFLTTSREPLGLPDERHVRIEPLAIADDAASPAVELFVSAAERVGASIDRDAITLVAGICEGLDGLPLSIELAAGQLRQMSLDELAERLDQRFELLLRRRRGSRSRQASLLAVVEDSWQMLDRPEQDVLLQLAAFPAGFGIDDVEELWSGRATSTARLLGGLVDRGLVSRSDDGRHRLLETIKLFAREKWRDRAPAVFAQRHRQWVLLKVTGRTREEWYTSTDAARWGIQHYADHRAVEDHLAAEGAVDKLSRLLAGLTYAYNIEHGSQASAVIDRIERYLGALPFTGEQRALLLVVSASACLAERQHQLMDRQFDAAAPLLREHGHWEALTFALCFQATLKAVRDTDPALEQIDAAVATARSAGSDVMCEFALAFRSAILALGGRIDEAAAELAELRGRLRARSAYDYASWACDLVDVGVHVVRQPSASRDAAARITRYLQDIEGSRPISWQYLVVASCAAAATSDITATRDSIARTTDSATAAGEDPLPDLLVPLATLAWALGDLDRARRWLTAVRHASTPTHGFYVTIIYRQLRDRVRLSPNDQLEPTMLHEFLDEALMWLRDLPLEPRDLT